MLCWDRYSQAITPRQTLGSPKKTSQTLMPEPQRARTRPPHILAPAVALWPYRVGGPRLVLSGGLPARRGCDGRLSMAAEVLLPGCPGLWRCSQHSRCAERRRTPPHSTQDVAVFLGVNPKVGLFFFDNSYRSVRAHTTHIQPNCFLPDVCMMELLG